MDKNWKAFERRVALRTGGEWPYRTDLSSARSKAVFAYMTLTTLCAASTGNQKVRIYQHQNGQRKKMVLVMENRPPSNGEDGGYI
jgi:hypothetical protein